MAHWSECGQMVTVRCKGGWKTKFLALPEWQTTGVFLSGESYGQRSLGRWAGSATVHGVAKSQTPLNY